MVVELPSHSGHFVVHCPLDNLTTPLPDSAHTNGRLTRARIPEAFPSNFSDVDWMAAQSVVFLAVDYARCRSWSQETGREWVSDLPGIRL